MQVIFLRFLFYNSRISAENLSTIEKVPRHIPKEIAELEMKDLSVIATLGVGGFGRVELVSTYHCSAHVKSGLHYNIQQH